MSTLKFEDWSINWRNLLEDNLLGVIKIKYVFFIWLVQLVSWIWIYINLAVMGKEIKMSFPFKKKNWKKKKTKHIKCSDMIQASGSSLFLRLESILLFELYEIFLNAYTRKSSQNLSKDSFQDIFPCNSKVKTNKKSQKSQKYYFSC